MAGMDDIDIFAGPERDIGGVPITGSSRDRQLDALRGMARQKYVDPAENSAKDMVKMQVAEALSNVPGVDGGTISSIIALVDSQNPDDKLMFNQIVSRLDLPVDLRRMGDDYAVSKRFEDVLGDNSSVGVSAFLPDEGKNQYSLSAEKGFPNFFGGEARVGGNISTGGDPEIRASYMRRFAEGGDVDIFDYLPSAAQTTNVLGSFAPGMGLADMAGAYPELPSGEVGLAQMGSGPTGMGFGENLSEGNYGTAALQGLGGIGDLAYAIPIAGPLVAGALKTPRAIQKLVQGVGSLGKSEPTVSPEDLSEVSELLEAVSFGAKVDGPIKTIPIFKSLGADSVRQLEGALKSNQKDLSTVDELVARAKSANDPFQAKVAEIASKVGGEKAGKYVTLKTGEDFDVEVKTLKSISDKVIRKDLKPSDFTDGVRTTIYVDTAEQAEEAVNLIGKSFPTIDRGWQQIPDTGYFDRKMNLLVTDPATNKKIVGEIQIKTSEMKTLAPLGHRWYEYSRNIETKNNNKIPETKITSYEKAMSEQRRLYKEALDAADPNIVSQLVEKFKLGGVVEGFRQYRQNALQN